MTPLPIIIGLLIGLVLVTLLLFKLQRERFRSIEGTMIENLKIMLKEMDALREELKKLKGEK